MPAPWINAPQNLQSTHLHWQCGPPPRRRGNLDGTVTRRSR